MRKYAFDRRGELGMNVYDYYAMVEAAGTNPDNPPTEVTEAEFEYFLNILPPITFGQGMNLFAVREALTGPVHAMYARIDGRYYSRYASRDEPATWITRDSIANAYPIDERDKAHFEQVDAD